MLLPNWEDGKFVIFQQKTRCAVSNVETVEVRSTAHDKVVAQGETRGDCAIRDSQPQPRVRGRGLVFEAAHVSRKLRSMFSHPP